MVPLTPSLYVPGTIADTEKVLVDIGTGYFVEKNVLDAQALIDRKIGMITGNADNLQAVARQKQKNLEVIMDMMRMRLRQPERQPEAR
jgi:prefoldin alpha subunit